MMFGIIICVLLFVVLYFVLNRSNSLAPLGAHVLITGGSSGIGLALAMEARKRGANVTIVARNAQKLSDAKAKISAVKGAKDSWVHTLSLDVTSDWKAVEAAVTALVRSHGPVHALFNCAGFAVAYYFEEGDQATFEQMMKVNFLGAAAVTHAVIPHMRQDTSLPQGVGGCVCFVSSVAGQVGVFGYTGYCASKFALRGFAEALYYELFEDNISVTVAFPPDTDTPGFEREQLGKPIETKTISEMGGLTTADKVATKILSDTLRRRFFCSIGFDGWLTTTMTTGMAPSDHFPQAFVRALMAFTVQMIGVGYRFYMRCLIRRTSTRQARLAKAKKSD